MESRPKIPEKLYFKIGEVSRITGVKPYIIRYWESEFPSLAPTKKRSNHRLFRRKDVEEILFIKELLYERKFTIAGAKQALLERKRMLAAENAEKSGAEAAPLALPPQTVAYLLARLGEIRAKL